MKVHASVVAIKLFLVGIAAYKDNGTVVSISLLEGSIPLDQFGREFLGSGG